MENAKLSSKVVALIYVLTKGVGEAPLLLTMLLLRFIQFVLDIF